MQCFLFPKVATRNKICYQTVGKAVSVWFKTQNFLAHFEALCGERALPFQNILLLLYTILLLLQFLMKPQDHGARIPPSNPREYAQNTLIILLLLPYLGLEKSQNFSLPIFSFTCPGHFLACPIIFRINSVRNGNSLVLISTL